MLASSPYEIFLSTFPGLEGVLAKEVRALGFQPAKAIKGGVILSGDWTDVWRLNLCVRGATKVLVRIGGFRAFHLAQLDKRSRKFPWAKLLKPGLSIKVEVSTNRKSKIYHAGAAIERIERAIIEEMDAALAPSSEHADVVIKTRIDDNNVLFSLDTSGIGLHKRGHKQAMGKAPLRETMAALLLRSCGYDGKETVLDPMCGSGTFLIEAAEIALGLMPGRARNFAFEKLTNFDVSAFNDIKAAVHTDVTETKFYGSDRNHKVVEMARDNAVRAKVDAHCQFDAHPVSTLSRPDCKPGLIIVNPPYGARIGKKRDLFGLYNAFGSKVKNEFQGWRVGLVTSDDKLAKATELPWSDISGPIAHGGLKVRLYQTKVIL